MSKDMKEQIDSMIYEIEKVILGKRLVIELTIAAMLADGHVLLEDIPGVGKTLLIKAISRVIDSDVSRIQATPDLLPSDILGVSIYDSKEKTFNFHPGPIFTSMLLFDEINRATPRTQSALLEAMAEKKVSIDKEIYILPTHFFVMATQNPIESEGTYPLPEAQLDRFMIRLEIGYPDFENELTLMLGKNYKENTISPVLTTEDLIDMKGKVSEVNITDTVARYALNLVEATRNHQGIKLGISPRGSIDFVKIAKAYAFIQGRDFVTPDDLQIVLPFVFSHRLKLAGGYKNQEQLDNILEQLILRVPVPVRR